MSPPVTNGIMVGVALALLQATISVLLLKWAWNKKSFYAVWGASTFARFLIFGATAFVVHRFTDLNLAVTLLSLAGATMVFMILEVKVFLKPNK